jgi:cell division septal protein FtsQ
MAPRDNTKRSIRPSSSRRPISRVHTGEPINSKLREVSGSILAFARYRLVFLVGTVFLGWNLVQAFTMADYRLTHIEVSGNSMIRAEQIASATAVGARNLFFIDRYHIETSVLGLRPLAKVESRLQLPNRLILHVEEREPAYVWRVEPTSYLVSRDGVILSEAGKMETRSVTFIDLDGRRVNVGEEIDPHALDAAEYLLSELPGRTGIRPTHFEYSRTFGVVLPTNQGFRVAFGQPDDLPEKVSVLRALLENVTPGQPPISFIDLRFKDNPYLR